MQLISRRAGVIPWPLIAGICIGILFAFPLAAPLMGGKILEPVATLWGNALGAIGAIAAAIWASDRASTMQRRQGASLILTFVAPLAQHLGELSEFYGRVAPVDDSAEQVQHVLDHATSDQLWRQAEKVLIDCRKFAASLPRVDAVLTFLGPVEMQAFFALEAEIANVASIADNLMHYASTCKNPSFGSIPSTGLRTYLLKTDRKVQALVSQLKKAAE